MDFHGLPRLAMEYSTGPHGPPRNPMDLRATLWNPVEIHGGSCISTGVPWAPMIFRGNGSSTHLSTTFHRKFHGNCHDSLPWNSMGLHEKGVEIHGRVAFNIKNIPFLVLLWSFLTRNRTQPPIGVALAISSRSSSLVRVPRLGPLAWLGCLGCTSVCGPLYMCVSVIPPPFVLERAQKPKTTVGTITVFSPD